ncbi:phage tail protein [Rosenbergiella collisarenosi]|uniref:phage tail protein n=1 Tax=Rosenbergiella collisarenosi TaxID=1544695 RepID=UPI001F4FD7DB|nr:phage tail protein [Rosenbergiella collisarenosi]
MSTKFYTLLTEIGAAKLASATALGVPLKITEMAVGDGGGSLPTLSAKQTNLVGERRRAVLNQLYVDPQNVNQIIAEQVIPENEGGWWIREVGLFDESGALIAVGNCAESYKPLLNEGSGRTQTVRFILNTSGTENVTLQIDPSVVLASRKYVDDALAVGSFPIGMPFFWPSPKMPNEILTEWAGMEFLKWNGATFSASKYPKLALVIPSLTLVEARGEFPRIWDDGRGVDSGRGLLSSQEASIAKHSHDLQMAQNPQGDNNQNSLGWGANKGDFIPVKMNSSTTQYPIGSGSLYMSSNNTTGIETRPRNLAFNFLVRAK